MHLLRWERRCWRVWGEGLRGVIGVLRSSCREILDLECLEDGEVGIKDILENPLS